MEPSASASHPPDPLPKLYSFPNDSGLQTDRKKFEGALTSYYASPNAIADRLTKWVFPLAAAFACEDKSKGASSALLRFPPNPTQTTGAVGEASVLLVPEAGVTTVGFGVPAAYFYALGANMPVQVTADLRYQMACGATAERVLAELAAAYDSGWIGDSYKDPTDPLKTVNPAQGGRRLSALFVSVASGPPQCPLTPTLKPLVTDWLAYPPPPPPAPQPPAPAVWKDYKPGAEASDFWPEEASSVEPRAFLELVLCALTQGYVLPGDAQPAPPHAATTLAEGIQAKFADGALPLTVVTLAGYTASLWADFFQGTTGYLPPFTRPGNQAAQVAAFIRYVQEILRGYTSGPAELRQGAYRELPGRAAATFDRLAQRLYRGVQGNCRRTPPASGNGVRRRRYAASGGDRVP